MPERWQAELQKLRVVQPSPGTWRRAQEPPSGDAPPPRRQRVVAGVVAVAIFLVAGAFGWRALEPRHPPVSVAGGPTSVVSVDLRVVGGRGGGSKPDAALTASGRTIEGRPTSYCWSFNGGSRCVDTVDPEFVNSDFVRVAPDIRLAISGDADGVRADLKPILTAVPPGQRVVRLGTITGAVALHLAPGLWTLHLHVTWPQGDVDFYFPLDVGSPTRTGVRSLRGTSWRLEAIDRVPVPSDADPVTLVFDPRRLGGSDGCNDYGGPYRVQGDVIKTGQISQNLVLCVGNGIMRRATIFEHAIRRAVSYDFDGSDLVIRSAHHTLTFVPTNP